MVGNQLILYLCIKKWKFQPVLLQKEICGHLYLKEEKIKEEKVDNDYINSHLIKWAELLYGAKNKCYAKSSKDHFVFGSKTKKAKNKITKEVAILLVLNKLKR